LITYGLVKVFPATPIEVKVGLMLSAAAARNGLVPKLAEKTGADIGKAISSLVSLAMLTTLSAPIVVALTIPAGQTAVTGADVAGIVLQAIVIPILIGVAIRQWWTSAADLITEPLSNSVVFDSDEVREQSTYKAGTQGLPPVGLPHVIVNGAFTKRDNQATDEFPGLPIRYPVEDRPRHIPASQEQWLKDFTIDLSPLSQ